MTMAYQVLLPSKLFLLGIVLWLLASAYISSCHNNLVQKHFSLSSPEKSSIQEKKKEAASEEELDSEDLNVFYPTNQWQTLQPGQAVPAGSHVRLNLQTGEREVKLPDGEKYQNNLKEQKKGQRLDLNTHGFTTQELKSALEKFKEGAWGEKEDKARQEEVRRRFRPIEDLKKDFEALNVVIESDLQIMVRLISQFNSSSTTLEEKIMALYDLEYYVHQMDNAQDLLSFGGLQVVISGLNSTENLVKEYSAFVLGAAFSSNPKVQVEAVEGGALQKLLVILATDHPVTVKKKVLFALSSLLRHFPYAQQQFLKLGGLQVLRSLVHEKGMEMLAVRVVTLLYDLVTEKMLVETAEHGQDPPEEKVQQYRQVELMPGLKEQGWCGIVSGLLGLPEHDMREKVLRTLSALLTPCRDRYRQDILLSSTLQGLRDEYQELAALEQQDGEENGYFQEMLGTINGFIQELR
ncbi:nucleotide exchange factor SIL1 [Vombatus ursinus]|uniref:Nucleotide exchange factor SIL1 n=1 Tax=Vombatus ursinus TaxID=29139 RepID=A0A4X2KQ42_VOMUR|nr:nucleotide exchange factor SIL1 [Vombatus ursinus]XP_027712300.1 nucleotide exchange factor SIL1 [Vombatus ursinus]